MGSSGQQPISSAFREAFLKRAHGEPVLRFDAFVDLALYDPAVGYYRPSRQRVGYQRGTDFFTASTSGPVFGSLVAAAAVKLLGRRDPREHLFVEIGSESPEGILAGVDHSFLGVRTVQLGGTLELSGPCVVFSNELFDAQPFRRLRFVQGQWRDLAVTLDDGFLREVVGPPVDDEELPLPPVSGEGYTVDVSPAAAKLTAIIARQPWTGVFLAFDYGKSWPEILEAWPAGTARAYYRHTQHNNLLDRPGEQDLTCHVCWDWLVDALRQGGFESPQLETQEAFFVHHAEQYIAPAIAADASQFTARKRSLLQLLHGAHLGQKFQVLHALR